MEYRTLGNTGLSVSVIGMGCEGMNEDNYEMTGRLFDAAEGLGINYFDLYACGGGTIPLLQSWLAEGMSLGSAAAFMITGPATKITNLGALKICMGWRRFWLYLGYVMLFSLLSGLLINLVL